MFNDNEVDILSKYTGSWKQTEPPNIFDSGTYFCELLSVSFHSSRNTGKDFCVFEWEFCDPINTQYNSYTFKKYIFLQGKGIADLREEFRKFGVVPENIVDLVSEREKIIGCKASIAIGSFESKNGGTKNSYELVSVDKTTLKSSPQEAKVVPQPYASYNRGNQRQFPARQNEKDDDVPF